MGFRIGKYTSLTRIGNGSFGQVFTVKDVEGNLYAAKIEPKNCQTKTIEFETKILKLLRTKYFPNFVGAGKTSKYTYLVMDLLGPSLNSVRKLLQVQRFSVSTGIRIGYHLLHAIEEMHNSYIIHRDIKPANIVIQKDIEHPIALVDFGLSRIYVDINSGKILPPRKHPGFRGTAIFASVSAHLHMELSRRDDLISWYYVISDLLTASLPWMSMKNRQEILAMKQRFDVGTIFEASIPELSLAWKYISTLTYEATPDYGLLYNLILQAMERMDIKLNDPYDWKDIAVQLNKNSGQLSFKDTKESSDIRISESETDSSNSNPFKRGAAEWESTAAQSCVEKTDYSCCLFL